MTLHLFSEAFSMLLQPEAIGFLLAGVIIGFVVGAIPGFNDTNILAILLPFTVYLGPFHAILFMLALYAGSQSAGPIPAILMNMPGTPSAAACCLDGYALTRKGLGKKALGASLTGSTIGGMFGAMTCIFLGPIVGKYALTFGPSEMFMVSLFGLSAVSTLAGREPLKGIVSAVFGLLVATIGTEIEMGYVRSPFGFFELYDGMPLIPVLLGLFGFAELFDLVNEKSIVDSKSQSFEGKSSFLQGMKEALNYRLTLVASSFIGVIIGIIPGTGAAIASWVGYGQSKNWSREPEKYGNGSIEGLVAVSAANNGVTGGALIPTITLGIPGSGTTLVIMTALMINNIQPGPTMFAENMTMVYAIFLSILLSTLLIFFLGIPVFTLFSKTTTVPTKNLVPVIAILSLTGSFAFRGMFFDFGLTLLCGLFGWILKKYNYSVSAFLLSLLLGGLAENNFLWALKLEGIGMFTKPICVVLLFLTAITTVFPIVFQYRNYLKKMREKQ